MNSQRTKQHICKPLQASPANQSLQKSCFLAGAPEDNFNFGSLFKDLKIIWQKRTETTNR